MTWLFRGDCSFFYIGGIVDHHCLKVIIRFVDIGRTVDHHCLEVIIRFVDIGGTVDIAI